jgi:hypothetical protein
VVLFCGLVCHLVSLAVGAIGYANNSGTVFVFDRSSAQSIQWNETEKLFPDFISSVFQLFGYALSFVDNRLLVGAPLDPSGSEVPVNALIRRDEGRYYGAAYLFQRSSRSAPFTQRAYLKPITAFANVSYGSSVSIAVQPNQQEVIIAGAPGNLFAVFLALIGQSIAPPLVLGRAYIDMAVIGNIAVSQRVVIYGDASVPLGAPRPFLAI